VRMNGKSPAFALALYRLPAVFVAPAGERIRMIDPSNALERPVRCL
jgi:hypothetical protein